MNPNENPTTIWLQQKFESWRYQKNMRKTVTEFARHVGISEDQMLKYMNGSEKPHGSNLAKMAGMLGFDIYELVGIKTSDMLDSLPPLFRVRFASAFTDYFEFIQNGEFDKDSPEAQQALKDFLKKYKLQEIFC